MIPHIDKLIKDSRKVCPICGMNFVKDAIVIEYLHEVYYGHYNYRWLHTYCFLSKYKKLLTPIIKQLWSLK